MVCSTSFQPLITSEWSSHTARVNSVSWTPDSQHLATGALDTSVIVWSPEKKMQQIAIKGEGIYFVRHSG